MRLSAFKMTLLGGAAVLLLGTGLFLGRKNSPPQTRVNHFSCSGLSAWDCRIGALRLSEADRSKFLGTACDMNDRLACWILAESETATLNGVTTAPHSYLAKACSLAHVAACNELVNLSRSDAAVKQVLVSNVRAALSVGCDTAQEEVIPGTGTSRAEACQAAAIVEAGLGTADVRSYQLKACSEERIGTALCDQAFTHLGRLQISDDDLEIFIRAACTKKDGGGICANLGWELDRANERRLTPLFLAAACRAGNESACLRTYELTPTDSAAEQSERAAKTAEIWEARRERCFAFDAPGANLGKDQWRLISDCGLLVEQALTSPEKRSTGLRACAIKSRLDPRNTFSGSHLVPTNYEGFKAYRSAEGLRDTNCVLLAQRSLETSSATAAKELLQVGCTYGNDRACFHLAPFRDNQAQRAIYAAQCSKGLYYGCVAQLRIVTGQETRKERAAMIERATDLASQACSKDEVDEACAALGFLDSLRQNRSPPRLRKEFIP